MNQQGHNNPPSIIEFALSSEHEITAWITSHPVLTSEEEAREGKALRDRVTACRKDLDAERKGRVDPLNKQVRDINDEYRDPDKMLGICQQELGMRLTDYIAREQAAKFKEAEKIRLAQEEALRMAEEKLARFMEAKSDAEAGAEADTVTTRIEAEKAMTGLEITERQLARADKAVDDARKVHGGWGRAYSQRQPEVLEIVDIHAAIKDMGITDKIRDAVLSSAREHRKTTGALPAGIRKRT